MSCLEGPVFLPDRPSRASRTMWQGQPADDQCMLFEPLALVWLSLFRTMLLWSKEYKLQNALIQMSLTMSVARNYPKVRRAMINTGVHDVSDVDIEVKKVLHGVTMTCTIDFLNIGQSWILINSMLFDLSPQLGSVCFHLALRDHVKRCTRCTENFWSWWKTCILWANIKRWERQGLIKMCRKCQVIFRWRSWCMHSLLECSISSLGVCVCVSVDLQKVPRQTEESVHVPDTKIKTNLIIWHTSTFLFVQ